MSDHLDLLQRLRASRARAAYSNLTPFLIGFLCAQFLVASTLASDDRRLGSAGLEEIANAVSLIHSEASPQGRAKLAESLPTLVRQVSPSEISSTAIDNIADMLGDSEDTVRLWAALALGNIGPPAAREIPALEYALENPVFTPGTMLLKPTMDSSVGIEAALKKIRGPSEP
jgi:hypothetical protein